MRFIIWLYPLIGWAFWMYLRTHHRRNPTLGEMAAILFAWPLLLISILCGDYRKSDSEPGDP